MLNKTYAQVRFSVFCDEVDTLETAIGNVIGDDDLLETEYAILDGSIDDAKIGAETYRIRSEKTLALWKLLQEFHPEIVPPIPPAREKKPARNRVISQDTACRYIRIYKGKTEWIQTDADDGYPILVDVDGDTRATIDLSGPPTTETELRDLQGLMSELPF